MSDMIRVPGPSSPLEGRSAKVIAVIVVGVLVAIIKPWGTSAPAPAAQASAALRTTSVSSGPSVPTVANYDPEVFGIYEPEARWELWPAGYLVSFGYAIRIDSVMTGAAPSGSAAPSSAAPSGSAAPSSAAAAAAPPPTPAPSRPPDGGPIWPSIITVSAGSHITLLAVNTPLGYAVDSIRVRRIGPGDGPPEVPIVMPPSPWPDHFTIIGVDQGNGRDARAEWPPGHYRVVMRFSPGPIDRSVDILIDVPDGDGPSASAAAPIDNTP
jgi:hypothetical protein